MQDQQGIRIVCIGDEYLSQVESGYFHTVFIDTDIHSTITFQLVKEIKFRIRDAQTPCKVRTGDCLVTVRVKLCGSFVSAFYVKRFFSWFDLTHLTHT